MVLCEHWVTLWFNNFSPICKFCQSMLCWVWVTDGSCRRDTVHLWLPLNKISDLEIFAVCGTKWGYRDQDFTPFAHHFNSTPHRSIIRGQTYVWILTSKNARSSLKVPIGVSFCWGMLNHTSKIKCEKTLYYLNIITTKQHILLPWTHHSNMKNKDKIVISVEL